LANTDITGFGTLSTQGAGAVAITGGAINSTTVGATTASTGAFTTLGATTSFTLASTTVTNIGGASGLAQLDSSGKLATGQIPASLVGAVVYQGVWNATANTPTITSSTGTKGWYYKVGTVGTTSIDGISSWSLGDTIIFDGTTWDKIDGVANEVLSVAGRTGVVTLAVADITGAAPLASPTFSGTVVIPGGTINSTTIGATTQSTGSFTTLAASGAVSGTGFSTYLASPPAIGSTAASTGAFTTLSASGVVSGTGFTNLVLPYALLAGATFTGGVIIPSGTINSASIGATTPSTGSFTTLAASGAVSGAGFSTYLASPPAIGSTAAGTAAFTTLTASGTVSGAGFISLLSPYATLASPTFTGTPVAPTAIASTNTTQLATTAFVMTQISTGFVNSVAGQSGVVTLANLTTGGVAILASPAFTGTPTAPTASVGTNTTQLATTAFVNSQGLYDAVTVFIGTGNYTMLATDQIVVINKTTGAATAVTLPATPSIGRCCVVKDGKGDAATNNITVAAASGTIDGLSTLTMDQPYESYTFIFNGTAWNLI
jgi:hypothetical protein